MKNRPSACLLCGLNPATAVNEDEKPVPLCQACFESDTPIWVGLVGAAEIADAPVSVATFERVAADYGLCGRCLQPWDHTEGIANGLRIPVCGYCDTQGRTGFV